MAQGTSWLMYALGGGFGHLTRAVALARSSPAGNRVRILTNSPYVSCVRRAMPELDIVALDPAMSVAEGRQAVLRCIEETAPDRLIVDTFPRGLAGELVEVLGSFSGSKVLVRRDLNPQYVSAYDLNTFISQHYDLVLDAEATPWLIRAPQELPSRDRARELLGLHNEKPCVIVCAAGNADELAWYGEVARLLQAAGAYDVRCIAPVCPQSCPPDCWVSYWPAIDLYAAADVVVGGGGYNTVYECLACGIPLIARPWPRKYDRQHLRASRTGVTIVNKPQEVLAAVKEIRYTRAYPRAYTDR